MEKKSAQVMQEIAKQYDLDKYVKDDYTSAIFKEFRKYGTKLIKIANYEDMEKRGLPVNQEMKDLMAKKDKFRSHLTSLQKALDLYASSGTIKPSAKAAMFNDIYMSIARLLVVGKVARDNKKLVPNPLKSQEEDLTKVVTAFESLTCLESDSETSITDEVSLTVAALKKLCEKSQDNVYGISGVQLAKILESNSTTSTKFRLKQEEEKPTSYAPLSPPGLTREEVKEATALLEDVELPPDPSKALPVSVLVAGNSEREEESSEELVIAGTGDKRYYEKPPKRPGRQWGATLRRPRGKTYSYIKKDTT